MQPEERRPYRLARMAKGNPESDVRLANPLALYVEFPDTGLTSRVSQAALRDEAPAVRFEAAQFLVTRGPKALRNQGYQSSDCDGRDPGVLSFTAPGGRRGVDPRSSRTRSRHSRARGREDQDPEGRLMPSWRPVKRGELVAALRRAGFAGPYSGGRHEFMQKGDLVLAIQNPHGGDIGLTLL